MHYIPAIGLVLAVIVATSYAGGNTGKRPTTIIIRKVTTAGQYVFIRGAKPDGNPLPIKHETVNYWNFAEYDTFKTGDNYLTWGAYETGTPAYNYGTPLLWSTDKSANNPETGYQPLNRYYDHGWMVTLDIDCNSFTGDWFPFKAFLVNNPVAYGNGGGTWEPNAAQGTCSGNGKSDYNDATQLTAPNPGNNHWAKCGYVNSFEWDVDNCKVDRVPTTIMLEKATNPSNNEYVFIRGAGWTPSSVDNAEPAIEHSTTSPNSAQCYANWKSGDTKLNWAVESSQGSCNGLPASGTPMVWSTNQVGNEGYQFLNAKNNAGPNYWFVSLDIDCYGNFYPTDLMVLRGVLAGGPVGARTETWDTGYGLFQGTCTGNACINIWYAGSSKNHSFRCGYVNLFKWSQKGCEIYKY